MLGVIELRRYTLHPGHREILIRLFDREFVEPQEAAGMRVIGQFRDLSDPDRFVWLRGFTDMSSRHWRPSTAGRCGRGIVGKRTPRWSTPTTCGCYAPFQRSRRSPTWTARALGLPANVRTKHR